MGTNWLGAILLSIILLFQPVTLAENNATQSMKFWVHLVYPSQYMLNTLLPFMTYLNGQAESRFSLIGGQDVMALLAECSGGSPQLIATTVSVKNYFTQTCGYKVIAQADNQVHILVSRDSAVGALSEVATLGIVAESQSTIIALREISEAETDYTLYPDYISLLKAYREGEVGAITLPSMFLLSDHGLKRSWNVIHTFQGTAGAVILASPLIPDDDLSRIQQIFLDNGEVVHAVWYSGLGLQPFYDPVKRQP